MLKYFFNFLPLVLWRRKRVDNEFLKEVDRSKLRECSVVNEKRINK